MIGFVWRVTSIAMTLVALGVVCAVFGCRSGGGPDHSPLPPVSAALPRDAPLPEISQRPAVSAPPPVAPWPLAVGSAPPSPTPSGSEPPPAIFGASDDTVFLASGLDERVATGAAAVFPRHGDIWTIERHVNVARLDRALRGWHGRTLRLFSDGGPPCESKVVEFRFRASTIPRGSTLMRWNGEDGPRPSKAEIASEIWDMVHTEERWLVGRLEPACPGAVWASDRAQPEVIAPSSVEGDVEAAALGAFRALPEYDERQRRFVRDSKNPTGRWEDANGRLRVRGFGPRKGLEVVVVSITAASDEFSSALSARFDLDVTGPAARVLRSQVLDTNHALSPRSAFDLDGDGSLELLTGPDGYDNELVLWSSRAGKAEPKVLELMVDRECPY